ncbi:NUDIX domain-containing protein [Streptomyces sp. DSM 110735]|uniref:NUDIX domain-containing protein n=1 Tax=Streptomyces sp. DSM 110735 TaxID=2775031 RepID=UPI0018F449AE|nr:NUDIX domain-containing protein [Streptomyces sp. DSM 110735]MBJ7907479.1 NUDIX domain-containing protein [Streptomyces sp. DSM 110735]
MTWEQTGGGVQAVVPYDGRLLLVTEGNGWVLPSGSAEEAESAEAAAARVVYELTGYLVDGSQPLEPGQEPPAVLCSLLTDDPSGGARLSPEAIKWLPFEEAESAGLPPAVVAYLRGHSPV